MFNSIFNSVLPQSSANSLDSAPNMKHKNTKLLLFLDAPGGSGKPIVTIAVQRFLKSRGKHISAFSSFGVAQLNYYTEGEQGNPFEE